MKKIKNFINNNEDIINAVAAIAASIAMIMILEIYGKINGTCI